MSCFVAAPQVYPGLREYSEVIEGDRFSVRGYKKYLTRYALVKS